MFLRAETREICARVMLCVAESDLVLLPFDLKGPRSGARSF
jgi:hypothetical protein